MAKYVERDVEFEDDVPIAPTIIIYYYSSYFYNILSSKFQISIQFAIYYYDTLCGLLYYIFEF